MKFKISYFLFLVVLLTSCGGTRNISNNGENLSAVKLIEAHTNASPNFKTLAARVQVVYEDENKLQSITTSLRLEKDKTIWIKASVLGVTLAKILITPTRVSYYETIGNTYFDGDFKLLSEFLGTDINFEKAQAILLGQSIFDINSTDYSVENSNGKFKLQPKNQPQDFIHSLFLNWDNYKVYSETLSQPSDGRLLTVSYDDYQNLEGNFYPSAITLNTSEADTKTKIQINYKKIDLNVDVSFPFDIPEGYEEIQLNK